MSQPLVVFDNVVKRFGDASAAGRPAEPNQQDAEFPAEPMTDFAIDALPAEVIRQRGGVRVAQYPALVDQGESVTVALDGQAATLLSLDDKVDTVAAARDLGFDAEASLHKLVKHLDLEA